MVGGLEDSPLCGCGCGLGWMDGVGVSVSVGASGRKVWGMDDWDEDLGWKPMGM